MCLNRLDPSFLLFLILKFIPDLIVVYVVVRIARHKSYNKKSEQFPIWLHFWKCYYHPHPPFYNFLKISEMSVCTKISLEFHGSPFHGSLLCLKDWFLKLLVSKNSIVFIHLVHLQSFLKIFCCYEFTYALLYLFILF